jgi:hypothetical protein
MVFVRTSLFLGILFLSAISMADEHRSSPAGTISGRDETKISLTTEKRKQFLLDHFVLDEKQAEAWEKFMHNETSRDDGPGVVMGELAGTIEQPLLTKTIEQIDAEKLADDDKPDGFFYKLIKKGLQRRIDTDAGSKKASDDTNFDGKFDAQYEKKKKRTECFDKRMTEMKDAKEEKARNEVAKKMQDECGITRTQALRYAKFYGDEKRRGVDSKFVDLSAKAMNSAAVVGGPENDDLLVPISEDPSGAKGKVNFINIGKVNGDWDGDTGRKVTATRAARAYADAAPKSKSADRPFFGGQPMSELFSKLRTADSSEVFKPVESGGSFTFEKVTEGKPFMKTETAHAALSSAAGKCQTCHGEGKSQSATPIKWTDSKFTVKGSERTDPYSHPGTDAAKDLTADEIRALSQYVGITVNR